jgi:hypothetical protein
MSANNWIFATLENDQLELIKEGETALGVDYLVAYRQDEGAHPGYINLFLEGLSAATLDDREIECLEGLEQRIQAVVVAYKRVD